MTGECVEELMIMRKHTNYYMRQLEILSEILSSEVPSQQTTEEELANQVEDWVNCQQVDQTKKTKGSNLIGQLESDPIKILSSPVIG